MLTAHAAEFIAVSGLVLVLCWNVDEEAAIVWDLEVDSLEISVIVEEVAAVDAVVGVGRVGVI